MDNIPVDGPASYQQQPSSNASTSLGGGLNFDENLKDIPQELAGQSHLLHQQPPQPPQPQPSSATGANNHASASSAGVGSTSNFNSSTSNLSAYPSVLAPAPKPHHFSPAPGIPPNAPPQTLPPLQPQSMIGPNGEVIQAPIKRPRGRPRKIPGTESRPRPEGQTAGRGRPKGSRGTRGRGRPRGSGMKGRSKRARASSSDDEDGDLSVGSSSEEEGRGSKRGRKGKEDDDDEDVDLNEEVSDDFGPEGKVRATTKFGRKISKPKSFIPTNKPTITRKKRQSTAASAFEANLTCQSCHLGHSPPGNALVICDSCSRGYHQLCHVPILTDDLVGSDLPFFCRECDEKISEMKKEENVLEGEWTTGRGENKVATPAAKLDQALPVPLADSAGAGNNGDGGEGAAANTSAAVSAEEKQPELTEEEKEAEKAKPYSKEVKKEWLLTLPLNILAGYVLSIEQKYAPTESPEDGLPIWPKDLPAKLQAAKDARAAEAAERERRLEEEAEALAAAVAAAETPGGGTETNSEAGTPLSFDILQPGDVQVGGARTAASKRLQSEREAREAAQQQQLQQQQAASTSSAPQNKVQPQPQQRSTNNVPAYMRPAIPMASALGGGGGGDIQVGGPSPPSNGNSNANAVALAQQQAQQAAAAAQAQANRFNAYPSYAQPANPSYGAVTGGTSGYGFLSGSTGTTNAGGLSGGYQSPAPGSYANMYAQPNQPQQQQQQQQQGGYSTNGGGSPWDRPHGGH